MSGDDQVIAYVDGFNLYHGMHQARGRRGLWLDLESLCTSLLRPGQELTGLHCFTALVDGPGRPRQQAYLDALSAHGRVTQVHVGRFQTTTHECRSWGSRRRAHEEKESDVSFGVQLVEDAALRRYRVALLVTADSDMLPAVRAARRLAPDARVVALPPRREPIPSVCAREGPGRTGARPLQPLPRGTGPASRTRHCLRPHRCQRPAGDLDRRPPGGQPAGGPVLVPTRRPRGPTVADRAKTRPGTSGATAGHLGHVRQPTVTGRARPRPCLRRCHGPPAPRPTEPR